jgi:hypothetical protein
MRLPTAATIALLLVAKSLSAQPLVGIIPHLAAGGPWQTVITVVNTTASPASATLLFWADNGQPLNLPIAGIGSPAGVQFTLGANGSGTVVTNASGPNTLSGWASVLGDPTGIDAIEVFRNHTSGRPDFEASVSLVKFNQFDFILPFDNTAGFFNGLALANSAESTSSIKTGTSDVFLTFRDESGKVILLTGLALPPGNHIAFLLADQYPAVAGLRGTVEVQLNNAATGTNGALFALGLRFDPAGAFTSIQPMLIGVTECVVTPSQ